jgi:branched-chain amino acid transport system ATP-binding protein
MLQLKNLSCGYGAFCAVSNLSLNVASGSIFALIGANGAGKTSTIMAIAGHVNVQSGIIDLQGENIISLLPQVRVRRGIAIVPEGRRLFSDLTVRENLIVGGLILDRISEDKRMEFVFSLFPRLSERVKQLAGSLSGGEQQMLAIGALMAEPKLLMIDEVSLGLMPSMVEVCYEAITKLKNEGMTILLVEQNTQQAIKVADDVAVLESGRMVWSGSGSDASKDPTLIEAYLGLK